MNKKTGTKPWLPQYDSHVPDKLDYPDITINDLLGKAIRDYSGLTFIRFRKGSLTYQQTGAYLKTLNQNLMRLGLKKGECAAILLPNIPQFVLAYYALLRAGAVVAALNPFYKQGEYAELLADCRPKMVICLDLHVEMLQELAEKNEIETIITTSIDDWKDYEVPQTGEVVPVQKNDIYQLIDLLFGRIDAEDLPLPDVKPDDAAIYQYSGGTTGTPKAAIGLHRNIAANVAQFRTWCGLREREEVILAAIPLYHVYGMVLAMNMGASLGASVVLVDNPRNVDFVLAQIEQHKVTFYPGVPSMYYAINQNPGVQAGKHDLRSIKACISGSAPLHPQIKVDFERLTGGRLMEGYGLSEAPTATHCNPLRGENKAGSIGLPLPDVDCGVVDLETGEREVVIGEIGELTLRGPQVMRAYLNQPQETQEALRGGWLHTGDVVRMDADGYFYIVDRKKDLIKVSGFQVWPNEVERVINAHPQVAESAVGGVADMAQGEKVIAWVVRKSEELTEEDVRAWCREKLAAYKVPGEVYFIEKLPRTGVGKVLRRELIKAYVYSDI